MAVARTSLVVVAAVRLYREGLATLLAARHDIALAGTASTADEALPLVSEHRPDVVVIDATTPGAIPLIEHIRPLVPGIRVIAFGVQEEDREILAWAAAGVSGYVPRDGSMDDLTAAIANVMRGEVSCSPRIAATLLRRLTSGIGVDGGAFDPATAPLTARERQILTLIDLGLSNKEIAQRLNIEVATVKNHVHHLLQKLHVTSRAAAAARFRFAVPK
ncbi:MAG TPA: response regulator transcription factor [Vicinamibacterales bacterium]|nr:response regulator transcription factor [Vicinamibacterales bacterium]